MQELNKASSIEVAGPLAGPALAEFAKQLRAWNIVMPAIKPLVLDFGLADFYRVGLIEYWIANEVEAGYCGKFLFLFDRQTCPRHHHREKLETFFIVHGTVEMDYDGRIWRMKPGDVLPVECGKPHQFSGVGPALILEISKPCIVADNYFADPNIPIGGNYKDRKKLTVK
jgi:N-acetylneuraminate synthase